MIHHLHTHYGEKLTVSGLAALAAMSPSHFARVFRRPDRRACGFATPSHFASTFRRHVGTTARGYRVRHPVATIWTMTQNLAPKRSVVL